MRAREKEGDNKKETQPEGGRSKRKARKLRKWDGHEMIQGVKHERKKRKKRGRESNFRQKHLESSLMFVGC